MYKQQIKHTNIHTILILWVILFLFGGCNENLPICPGSITVTVFEAPESIKSGEEPANGDITLFIFDSNQHFIGNRKTKLYRTETIHYPDAGKLTIVAWNNIYAGSVDVTSTSHNSTPDNSVVSLKKAEPSAKETNSFLYKMPDDLFYGKEFAYNNGVDEQVKIYIKRAVSSINITARNLKKFAGYNDDNYHYEVGTSTTMTNFNGLYSGSGANYKPTAQFNTIGDLIAPTFRVFPSKNETLSVRIYHEETLIDEVFSDINGKPLQCIENKTLYVLIDYTDLANVVVRIKETEWNPVMEWDVIFNK